MPPLSQRVSVGVKRYMQAMIDVSSITLNKASELRTDCIGPILLYEVHRGVHAEITMGVPITAPEYRRQAVLAEFCTVRCRGIKVVTRVLVPSLS